MTSPRKPSSWQGLCRTISRVLILGSYLGEEMKKLFVMSMMFVLATSTALAEHGRRPGPGGGGGQGQGQVGPSQKVVRLRQAARTLKQEVAYSRLDYRAKRSTGRLLLSVNAFAQCKRRPSRPGNRGFRGSNNCRYEKQTIRNVLSRVSRVINSAVRVRPTIRKSLQRVRRLVNQL
jgi:hypothetical protein